jgi:hypothetical protein
MASNLARTGFLGPTEVQRRAYYRDLAAQFRGWAEDETDQEASDRLLEMAREYERLANHQGPENG